MNPLRRTTIMVLLALGWRQLLVGADSTRHPAREDTYTLTSVMQIVNPIRPADMTDDFQDVRVIAQDKDSATVEITYYPLYQPAIGENPNWRKEDAAMTEYLKPAPAANWDEKMQKDLFEELHAAGIDPDALTDREVVRKVSAWAMKRSRSTNLFAIWCVAFPDGKPEVLPELRAAFDKQKPKASWTDQQMFEQETLGRGLFYNKVHGSCTSSSVYLTTIFRALGIPTRTVICIPPFDPNDKAQAEKFYAAIHHHRVRETVRAALNGLTGFDNHLFNEVFIDHCWVRLNYSNLGQPILDSHYFGLLTHIYTCADVSDVPLAATWGQRYFKYPSGQPRLSSVNPYQLLSVSDHFGDNAQVDNPEVPIAELRTATIVGIYPMNSPELPAWIDRTKTRNADFLLAIRERMKDAANPLRSFEQRAGRDFVLHAPDHPDVHLQLAGLTVSDSKFWAFSARIAADDREKFERGVAYRIEPVNQRPTYQWAVADDLAPLIWMDGEEPKPAAPH